MTSGRTPALAQSVEGHALAYISIPLDGATARPAYGLRLDLGARDGAEPGDAGPGAKGPPPVLEVRFGSGEDPGEARRGGIVPAMIPDRLDLDGGAALWLWTGLGVAAVAAIVIATDAVCIGINTTCSKDKDDDHDKDDGTN